MIGICGGHGFQPSRPRGRTLTKILKAVWFRTTFEFDDSDSEKRFDAVLSCPSVWWLGRLWCIDRRGGEPKRADVTNVEGLQAGSSKPQ